MGLAPAPFAGSTTPAAGVADEAFEDPAADGEDEAAADEAPDGAEDAASEAEDICNIIRVSKGDGQVPDLMDYDAQ